MLKELGSPLGVFDFGDWIIFFGPALLLSVLPLVIILNALANQRLEDNIAQHLGLHRAGSRVVEGLFKPSSIAFNRGVLVSLLLAFAGTIAVPVPCRSSMRRRSTDRRGVVWSTTGAASSWWASSPGCTRPTECPPRPSANKPAGRLVLGVVNFAVTLFF